MTGPNGVTAKSVYIEVSKELWSKIKIICFKKGITLKQFITEIIERELSGK